MRSGLVLLLVAAGCGSHYANAPLTTDEATAACVSYAACTGSPVGVCFSQILPVLDNGQARCVASAGHDCVRAAECLGTTISLGQSCEEDTYSCSGSQQVVCLGAATTYIDCEKTPQADGPTCVVGASGQLMCGVGSCTETDLTCEGGLLTECLGSERIRVVAMDCAAKGMTCGTVEGDAACVGAGRACTPATPRCEGTLIVWCPAGQEATEDCAAKLIDGTCVPGEGQTAAACALGSECNSSLTAETCEGDTLTFCAAGLTRTARCSDLGFGPCQDGRCQAYPID